MINSLLFLLNVDNSLKTMKPIQTTGILPLTRNYRINQHSINLMPLPSSYHNLNYVLLEKDQFLRRQEAQIILPLLNQSFPMCLCYAKLEICNLHHNYNAMCSKKKPLLP